MKKHKMILIAVSFLILANLGGSFNSMTSSINFSQESTNLEKLTITYGSYFGGNNSETGRYILLDSSNNPILLGQTWSDNFPTTISHGTPPSNSTRDVFVTKFNGDNLSEVMDSIVFGGSGNESTRHFALDQEDNIYILGQTSSTDLATPNAYDTTFNGGNEDGFVAKIAANGTVLFITYIGGSADEWLSEVDLDSSGNIWISGTTNSDDFYCTPDAYDSVYGVGVLDDYAGEGIYAKLSSNGSALLYSSYFGGSESEQINSLVIDDSDNIVLSGWTRSSDFNVTADALNNTINLNRDNYISKFTPNGSSLLYSTFIGGSSNEEVFDITLDNENNYIISGWTASLDFPVTPDAYDTSLLGLADAFLLKLSADGSSLIFSTFIGGGVGFDAADCIANIVVDTVTSDIVGTGWTESYSFPTTDGSTYKGDWSDVIIVKFSSTGALLNSSMVGASDTDWSNGICLLNSNEAYLGISSWSSDFPVTSNAYMNTSQGFVDAMLIKVEFPYPEPITTTTTTVEGTNTTTTAEDTTTTEGTTDDSGSGFEFIILFCTVSVLAFRYRRRKR
ncbi:MAG: hypothetical protein ACW98G_16765 [Candidatus Hodarchaeales archaeon]